MKDTVVQMSLNNVLPLRVEVLRKGTPATHCSYPEDSYDDAVHLCIVRHEQVVATSTWFSKPCPLHNDAPAVQLKGMAVSERLHGQGLGEQLIAAGVELAEQRGATLIWARARDSALGFYIRCGFGTVGDGFVDEPTGMPHHIVVRHLNSPTTTSDLNNSI